MKKRKSGNNIRKRNKRMTHCDMANSPDFIPETTTHKIKLKKIIGPTKGGSRSNPLLREQSTEPATRIQ
jgi:hypothetical protein